MGIAMTSSDNFFVKQLLAGRDHARSHPIAGQMMNFAYLVGCKKTRQCLVVDPSWDPKGIVDAALEEDFKVVGAVATHAHPDHVGGRWMGFPIPGIKELMKVIEGPVHVHTQDSANLASLTGVDHARVVAHEEGDVIEVGEVRIEVLHTPGHTPGHLVLLCEGHAITGDLLFVGSCGRTDLPGADIRKMGESLLRMRSLPDDAVVLPGHHYGHAVQSTIGVEKRTNMTMRFETMEEWLGLMGG
jgi:glyoxylase-like metal-dependent hydrolase (beta-lactamase superfamily II)